MARLTYPSAPLPPHDAAAFDTSLWEGRLVRVRWTAEGIAFDAVGRIAKLTGAMVQVALVQDVERQLPAPNPDSLYYPASHVIKVPRMGRASWGVNCCVVPYA